MSLIETLAELNRVAEDLLAGPRRADGTLAELAALSAAERADFADEVKRVVDILIKFRETGGGTK